MAPFTKSLITVTEWMVFFILASSVCQDELTVKAGDSATLSCVVPTHTIPSMFSWLKKDLSDGCLYFYRDGITLDSFQHPSFQRRVMLSDPNMTDGDVSLILLNVTVNDTGTYECQCIARGPERSKRGEPDVIRTISLKVEDSGHAAGNILDGGHEDKNWRGQARLIIVLSVVVVFALVVVVLFIFYFYIYLKRENTAVPQN